MNLEHIVRDCKNTLRGIFLRLASNPVGKKETPKTALLFWSARQCFINEISSSRTLCSRFKENFHKRSSLKTLRRSVFFTVGFESCLQKRNAENGVSFFGLPDKIRTCALQSRSLLHYPAVLRADIFNFPRQTWAFLSKMCCPSNLSYSIQFWILKNCSALWFCVDVPILNVISLAPLNYYQVLDTWEMFCEIIH